MVKQVPIIAVCQQNRSVAEGKTFDTTQLAQSDKIGQDATAIIFIERKADLFKLHLVKCRDNGAGAVLSYKVDLNTGDFTYINENEDEESNTVSYGDTTYSEDEVF